jgi:tetratricopeptide (TPR) repeat protein
VSAFYTETGDIERTAQLLDRQLLINRRTGNIEGEAGGLLNLGYAYILLGMPDKSIPLLQRCIHLAESIDHRSFRAYGSLNLALAFLYNGTLSSARAELDQCLPELKAMNDAFGYAVGQTYNALVAEHEGQENEALSGFNMAIASLREIGALGNEKDAEAGVVRCLLRLNNLEEAKRCAAPLWDYLQRNIGVGMEFPMLAYETCAEVYSSAGEEALARSVIEAGYRELMKRADKISLLEWRQSYLEHVPEHHRIQAYWHKYTQTSIE